MKLKLFLTLFSILIFCVIALPQTVKLTDFGAIPNDGLLDDVAFTKALESMRATGGTLEFPCGVLDLSTEQSFVGNYVSWKLEGNQCAILRVASPVYTLIRFGNSPLSVISGLTFLGVPANPYDTAHSIVIANADRNVIRDSKFVGLRSPLAIVLAGGEIGITDSLFGGNSAQGVVMLPGEYQQGGSIIRTNFIDYANLNGTHYSKTPYGNGSWVLATGGPSPTTNYRGQRQLRVEDGVMDEGAQNGAINASDIFAVTISGLRVNVAGIGGVYLSNVRAAKLEGNWFGYSGYVRPAIIAVNGTKVLVKDQVIANQVFHGTKDGTSEIEFNELLCAKCRVTPTMKN